MAATQPNSSSDASKPAPARVSNIPGPVELLKALRRRWLLAAFLGLTLAGLAGAGVWYGLPEPKHSASVVFHVAASKPMILDGGGQGWGEFSLYQQSQKALVTSRLVLNSALRDPRIAELSLIRNEEDPVDWLQRELKVDFKMGPEYMRLSLNGDRPEEQKVIVSAVADAYLKEIVNRERNRQLARLAQLKESLAKHEESLRRKNKSIRELRLAVGSRDHQAIAARQRYAFEAAGMIRKELLEQEGKRRRLELEIAAQEERDKRLAGMKTVPSTMVEEELRKDPTIKKLQAHIDAAETELERLSREYTRGKDEPSLRPRIKEIDDLKASLEARGKALRPVIAEQLLERSRNGAKEGLAVMREQCALSKQYEKVLQSEIDRLEEQARAINLNQIHVEDFEADIKRDEKVADQLGEQAKRLEVELDAPARVSMLEEPYVSQENAFRRKIKAAGSASGMSLLLVLTLIGWREHRRRRIDSTKEVSSELGLALMGTVPALPNRRSHDPQSAAYQSWQGALTESIDTTRTRLLHVSKTDGMRMVMVTSAVPREGKTSLACHLAASLARAGQRTLLLDGDLRLPAIHRVFNVELGIGFSEVLRGEALPCEAVRQTPVEGLFILTAGRADGQAIRCLAQQFLQDVLNDLRHQFDFVVVDSAPVLPVADSLLVGQHMDGVILSVLRGTSQVPLVQEAHQRLEALGIRTLGAVFSGAELNGHYGSHYGYSRYGYPAPPPEQPA